MSQQAKLAVEYKVIADLRGYENNSRTHSEKQIKQISKSIEQMGFTNPILIDETNCIIAGHGRLEAAKQLKMEEVPTITLYGLTEEQKSAYVIADNKIPLNAGWNEKMLMRELFRLDDAKFDITLTGFSDKELKDLLDIDLDGSDQDIDGEIKFSDELMPEHNYVVLYFDNEIDWLSAKTHFDLDSKYSKRSNGKPWSKGIGRVINGAQYLTKIKGA